LAEGERSIAMNDLVDEDSEGPYVSLRAVDVFNETFRRHVDWTPNINVLKPIPKSSIALLRPFCETKIGDFGDTFVEKDVRNFEISVNDRLLCQILQALKSLVDCSVGLPFRYRSSSANACLKVTISTHLCDDVTVVGAGKNFVATQDVWVVECLQYLDLGI